MASKQGKQCRTGPDKDNGSDTAKAKAKAKQSIKLQTGGALHQGFEGARGFAKVKLGRGQADLARHFAIPCPRHKVPLTVSARPESPRLLHRME